MKQSALFFVLCLVIAGIPRLFSLDAHWSSDEVHWLRRSAVFMDAVSSGSFEQTLIAHHPGVTTMWSAGLRQVFMDDAVIVSLKDLALARWFIGIVVLSGLGASFFLIHRLLAFWPTVFAWGFLAVNPFFLAQSRRVHTDALATLFILLTVLLFILYCVFPKKRSYLIFSGVAFGLACLSKSYALILLPWLPMCSFAFRQCGHRWRDFFSHTILSIILFLNCSLLTVLALWPIFWNLLFGGLGLCLFGFTFLLTSQEKWSDRAGLTGAAFAALSVVCFLVLRTSWQVFSGVEWAVTTAHEVEHFFFGKVVYDPGWIFYLLTLSIKSTPFTVPLVILGFVFLWKQRRETYTSNQHFQIAISLLCSMLLFILCLSLTAKKFSRYLLPVFPILDLLAGFGLFYGVKWIRKRFRVERFRQVGQIASIVLIFALTAIPVFALHPYYGTYYNTCWKVTDITKLITVGEASGLDLAATYLNQKPHPTQLSVQVSPLGAEFFQYYFKGSIYRADKRSDKGFEHPSHVDYEVVYIRDSQIGWVPQTGTRNGKLEHTIVLNGISQVWIYQIRQEAKE